MAIAIWASGRLYGTCFIRKISAAYRLGAIRLGTRLKYEPVTERRQVTTAGAYGIFSINVDITDMSHLDRGFSGRCERLWVRWGRFRKGNSVLIDRWRLAKANKDIAKLCPLLTAGGYRP